MTENATSRHVERKTEQLISALLVSRTLAEAAALLSVSVRTVQRWMRHGAFQEQFRQAKRNMLQQALGKLRHDSGTAAAVLAEISSDTDAPHGARVTAASRLLELGLHAHEMENLEERMDKLEAALEGDK
ncbi:MAG: hypothetical protein ACYCO5_10300 [Acidobacteriaceae bacterium]